jgi:hypothetical protein
MNKKLGFIGLGLAACTSLISLTIIFPSFSQSTASKSQPVKTTFVCGKKFDQSSGERIPVTAAWIPERKIHVYFIGWKSEFFNQGGWTPEKRCEMVTQKFQEFYAQNRLNYITSGQNNGYPIICGVANLGEPCNQNNQLFTIRTGSNADAVVLRLMDIAEGKTSELLLQNSGSQAYIPVKDFLAKSPAINIQDSANNAR